MKIKMIMIIIISGYIFACCIALAPSFPLVAGFTVQSLLAVLLLPVSKYGEGKFLGIRLRLPSA